MLTIDSNTSVTSLKNAFEASSGYLPIKLNNDLTVDDLKKIAKNHCNQPYSTALYQLLVNHPQADSDFFQLLLQFSNRDDEISNAIITSGKATDKILQNFLQSESISVVHHALIALLSNLLNNASDEIFDSIISQYQNDSDISIASRYIIASHKNTPERILRQLGQDDYDHIAQAAKDNLNNKI